MITKSFWVAEFYYGEKKETEKASDVDIRKGAHLLVLSKLCILFQLSSLVAQIVKEFVFNEEDLHSIPGSG